MPETARRFGAIVLGSMLLLAITLALLVIDYWQTNHKPKRHERDFEHHVNQ